MMLEMMEAVIMMPMTMIMSYLMLINVDDHDDDDDEEEKEEDVGDEGVVKKSHFAKMTYR